MLELHILYQGDQHLNRSCHQSSVISQFLDVIILCNLDTLLKSTGAFSMVKTLVVANIILLADKCLFEASDNPQT